MVSLFPVLCLFRALFHAHVSLCLCPWRPCSPCRVWPASAWLCARAAAGRSRTATTCWPWTNSGTCAASSAASANSTWSRSSPASARTAASTARRTTTGRRARGAWSSTLREHCPALGLYLGILQRNIFQMICIRFLLDLSTSTNNHASEKSVSSSLNIISFLELMSRYVCPGKTEYKDSRLTSRHNSVSVFLSFV